MDSLSIAALFAIGIILIGLEALFFSFVLFFIGLGFLSVALISFLFYFNSGITQIALAFVIGTILAIILRKPMMDRFVKPQKKENSMLKKRGIGIVEDGMVKFEGTYWAPFNDISSYKNGDSVEVIDIVDNKVVIKDKS